MKSDLLSTINEALISGLDGMAMSSGDTLTVRNKPDDIVTISDDALPFLLLDLGRLQFQPWQFWDDFLTWYVTATLKVKAEPGETDRAILAATVDLIARLKRITGLPIDESGKVVPYGPETRKLYEAETLDLLVERGAPYLRSVTPRPSDGPYGIADLVIHLETTIKSDPRGTLPRAQVAILGANPSPGSIAADPSRPDPQSIAVVADSDAHAWGGYDTDNPRSRKPQNRVAGISDADRVRQVTISPGAVSLSAGSPTQQLQSIAYQNNWASAYVTGQSSWTSADHSIATVSGTGLVTRVAAGSTSVTCTYQGVASSAVAVVCT